MRKGMTVRRSRCIIWCRGKSDVVDRLIWTCLYSQAEGKDVLNSDIRVGRQRFSFFFPREFSSHGGSGFSMVSGFQVSQNYNIMKSSCKAYELCLEMKQCTGGDGSN